MRLHRFFLSAGGAEGNGDGGDEGDGKVVVGKDKPKKTVDELASEMVEKYDQDATGMAKMLLRKIADVEKDSAKARERARAAEAELAAREDRLEAGSLILNPEKAKIYEQYTSLGTVRELRQVIREHADRGGKLAEIEREKELEVIKDVMPSVRLSALKPLVKDERFELKETRDKMGKKIVKVQVKVGDAEPVDFDEYVDLHWREFRPVLFEGSRPAGSGGTPRRDLVGARPSGRIDIEKLPAGENLQEFFEKQSRAQGAPLL